jgi:hypothetical protein
MFGKEPLRRDGKREAIFIAAGDKGVALCAQVGFALVQ